LTLSGARPSRGKLGRRTVLLNAGAVLGMTGAAPTGSRAAGFDPMLLAAANSSGGVMGKMTSLQSLAVACAATG